MAHVISDECVSCGACEAECPVGAISQGADHFEIDADACVDCGACAAQCPTGAISQGYTGCTGDKDNRQRDAAISASETGVSFCLQIYFYLPDTILLVSRNQYAMIQLSNINRTSCNSSDSFH